MKRIALAGLLALAACAQSPRSDLLLLRTSRGVAVMDPGAGTVLFRAADAVPSRDWSRVLRVERHASSTRVVALDSATGAETASRTIEGDLEVRSVSHDGRAIALATRRVVRAGYPAGRSSTPIVVIGAGDARPRRIELAGNYEPEAFSLDGSSLFAIEYLPALAPDRYRVRRIDLRSGRAEGVRSVDKDLQESMRGTARTQAMSPDGRRLYTMYTLDAHAFVHVLSLDEVWAHCVDLPAGFGAGGESGVALAVSPDSSRLFVADTNAGSVAEVDTKSLDVVRTAALSLPGPGPARAAAAGDRLYVGRGRQVIGAGRSFPVPGIVSGIQVSGDGRTLYVALGDRIAVLDAVAGRTLRMIDARSIGVIEQLGRTEAPLESERTEIVCAC